ncbi:hypothetical protein PGT21_009390 [Puccinia graminis f. sp. tritici]|uniref:Uncharacterized protein n=1 Tax=Puccinia graminis f. sp. tritici TaxID=56615 RepID=A0A5B0N2H1_PUCGR|nr:hypothetical protein PGTUg99_033184 [Puccinia graminis f. sp. tritici]KAA1094090.1 hypothetical protein PGT21_009390 [Puccinia graminis f. sp. tritici]
MPPRKKQPIVAGRHAPPNPSAQAAPNISYLMNSDQNQYSPQMPIGSQHHRILNSQQQHQIPNSHQHPNSLAPFQAAPPPGLVNQGLQHHWQPSQQPISPLPQNLWSPPSLPSHPHGSSNDSDDDEGMQSQSSVSSARDPPPSISASVRSAQSATQSVQSTMASMQLSGTPLPTQTPQPMLSEFTPSQQTERTESSQKKTYSGRGLWRSQQSSFT